MLETIYPKYFISTNCKIKKTHHVKTVTAKNKEKKIDRKTGTPTTYVTLARTSTGHGGSYPVTQGLKA